VPEGRSAWSYILIGCLALVVIVTVFIAGAGFWLYRGAKSLERSMKDPQARAERVLEVLGADTLPEGYHPMMAFKVPFLMQVAILSGREPAQSGEMGSLGDRGLIYIQLIYAGQDRKALRDYFEGRTSDPSVLADNHIQLDVDEIIDRGVVPLDPASLMYVAQRGKVSMEGFDAEGITSLILIECPEDSKNRMAIWFAPDPRPAGESGAVDLTGTPADPEAIAGFMTHFRLCASSAS
jgi:hypothetical protein